ncbi:alpha/beta fold hydrolase [Aliidiomarina indica]|uniref:alpha/beta fold hydrolase n=1 Tax=Aliidiomarina indica TaxID=2749147 RepID=UPI0018900260|nr:alpha/beta fold hydrolase [Aliidiomarina indica]
MILNYETSGKSSQPAIILVHGLFGDLDNLKSISRALQDDYYVVNIELRNHGNSPWTDSMALAEMAEDIREVMQELDIESAYLLGHSLGGKVVMEFALKHPEQTRALIVADIAPVAYDARHTSILDALEALNLDTINSRQDADKQLAEHIDERGVRSFLLKNLRKEDDQWQWRMNLEGLRSCYPDLIGAPQNEGTYKGPVLFIRGGRSDYVTEKHRPDIQARFPAAESKTIAETGHWLHAEKPQVFNGIVQRFLEDIR